MDAYLCIVKWPDGTEGLLFPRPGNVPIADTLGKGMSDFAVAKAHLQEYVNGKPDFHGTQVRLVMFGEVETLTQFVA